MKTLILRTAAVGLAATLFFTNYGKPAPQYLPPVACIGLSAAVCADATSLLREHISRSPDTYNKWPEKWEVASEAELDRIRNLYPTRRGHWLSNETFVLFLEPPREGLHSCAPSEIILTNAAVKEAVSMAYVRGYMDGACEGMAQNSLYRAKK